LNNNNRTIISDNKNKIKFPHILIFLILISEPSYNFLMLYDFNLISIQGLFKIFDIFIALLVFLYFFRSDKSKVIIAFNDSGIKWLIAFIVFYIIYTPLIAKTSNLLEAFRAGRLMLYVFLFYIFNYYINNEKIFYAFFMFLKYTVYITGIIIIIELIGINILVFHMVPKDYGIPRIYFTHFTLMLFLLTFGIIQRIVKYNGEYKIKNIELILIIFYIITSLTRSLWIATLGLLFIIQIISMFKIYKYFRVQRQIFNVFLILFVIVLFIILINYSGLQNIFIDRITFASNDIKYGEGTFSGRIQGLDIFLNSIVKKMGLIYTGLGFPHGYSDFINSFYFLQSDIGSWGSETGIGMALIYFGYIGAAAFHFLIFIIVYDILKRLKTIENKLAFSIGLSLAIVILTNFIFITWASPYIMNFINLAFFLSFFNASVNIFEK
jgi:hypothetical protein